jgi:hypothetical protein
MLERVPHEAFGTQAARVFKTIADCVMAIDERLGEDMAALVPVDSTKLLQEPVLLRGNSIRLQQACRLMRCTNVKIQSEKTTQGRMPNCRGMSARDAVELLHSLGLKVRVSGYGKVASQSPQAGTAVKKGAAVVINLK